jgi:hypothetical protein
LSYPVNQNHHDEAFERPRTPPIATTADDMQIETIAVNGEIEDTFFNEDNNDTMTEQLQPVGSNNHELKKFIDLPNFLSVLSPNETTTVFSTAKSSQKQIESKCRPRSGNNSSHKSLLRKKDSCVARKKYVAPANKCGLRLNSVIGYNGKNAAKRI